ncbi:MAG: MBL fold metallo-hydrolase [candidate division WOR-3 bacterium]|nr:MBL fold metallo-hydrolase [candidate division WOR-3 bacterium]MCX7948269.1 MBL fold metallo-hydrolase [candidate division WOR-3 bacterium]MDW8150948.1 MBL fold metallo-hydrolase [candidate division WOR-3 bacterium]
MKIKLLIRFITQITKVWKNMRELEFKVIEIDKNFKVLGNAYAYMYYISAHGNNILIDTGTAFYGYKLRDFLKNMGIKKINYLLITHSHYDHIGGVPIILESFIVERIFAHSYIKNVFSSQRALSLIENLNKIELKVLNPLLNYSFKSFEITDEVKEGDILDFEDIKIHFLETPGHTRDSVSYYILPWKVIIPGEACGVPNSDDTYILPQFLSSLSQYINSIQKIMKLDIEILGLPHEHLIFGRENIKRYLEDSLKTTYEYVEIIENAIKNISNFEKVLDFLTEEIHSKKRIRQPIHAFRENLKAQVITISRERGISIY